MMGLQTTAWHEAAHLVVFIKLGGRYKPGDYAKINPDHGGVRLSLLIDREYGFLLEACTLAAGIACDEIVGHQSFNGNGSDAHTLQELYPNSADQKLIVRKVRQWMEVHWAVVHAVSRILIANRVSTTGLVPRRAVLQCVQLIKNWVRCRRVHTQFR